MSGGLISRSKLLEMLNYNKAINEDNAKGKVIVVPVDEIIKYVEKMPTAYDVDKVVAELEKAECHMIGQHYFEDGIAKSIEIVKAGGVE